MACLISSNAFFAGSVHSIFASFYSISLRGLTIFANPVMNFRTKLIFPNKDSNSFWLDGKPILDMASTQSGSIRIPFSVITWPSNFPSITQNIHFLQSPQIYTSSGLRKFHIFYISEISLSNLQHDFLFSSKI